VTNCTAKVVAFPACKRRKVEAQFSGGDITSDGGVLLLRQVDRRLGLTEAMAKLIPDPRDPVRCQHRWVDLLRQRVYGIGLGYEDLNDHQTLRQDAALQTALGREEPLASPATLCRFEHQANRAVAWVLNRLWVEQFIASFEEPPQELILDFDATDDPLHGRQEGRFFHGYYDCYCFLPLYVFCGDQLLVSYLRPSNSDGAKHAWAILALLVKRFREVWPQVRIIFRADSGFCRHRMLSWGERRGVDYLVGITKNTRLTRLGTEWIEKAQRAYERSGEKQRLFGEFQYAADTWGHQRRVVVRAEHADKGSNPRYLVTSLAGPAQRLYEELYCARGEMENRIKEQQLDLFADRTSCHPWWPNQLRLLLSSAAYCLIEAMRRWALSGTELAQATCGTIRLKLFKIGAVIVRNTRRIRFLLSSSYPYQALFFKVAARLRPG
jgi:Transposase DDE domain group 1